MTTQYSLGTATRSFAHFDKPRGVTMVELMVALAISSILMLGVGTVYVTSKHSYKLQDELAKLQEDARFVYHTMTTDLRMAGYVGCSKLAEDQLVPQVLAINPPGDIATIEATRAADEALGQEMWVNHYITGHSDSGGGTFSPGLYTAIADTRPDTDAVTVFRGSECSASLSNRMADETSPINVFNNCGFTQGDVLMVSDCARVDIFEVTNDPPNTGAVTLEHDASANLSAALSAPYQQNAQVMRIVRNTYVIRDDPNDPDLTPTLFKMSFVNQAGALQPVTQPLVRNVEDMRVLYGVDTNADGSADTFQTADQVGQPAGSRDTPDWGNVTALKVS
ncbi:MAG: PilW family protein, partial [Pseudomonadota bacterium]